MALLGHCRHYSAVAPVMSVMSLPVLRSFSPLSRGCGDLEVETPRLTDWVQLHTHIYIHIYIYIYIYMYMYMYRYRYRYRYSVCVCAFIY